MRDYAAMTTLVMEKLQSSSTADFSVSEVTGGITRALADIGDIKPRAFPISFWLEGRYGTDVTGAASTLTDSVKGQFLAADTTKEKVVHNTTDNTWAVIKSFSSTAAVGLSADIMGANENYEIYNKQCVNHKQLFIGDVPNNGEVLLAEYPIGTRRNWKQNGNIIELKLDSVVDTNANTAYVTIPENPEVLVKFKMPHSLPNLTDWAGVLAATVSAGATTISGSALQAAGTINEGTELTIAGLRMRYLVASSVTIASNTAAIVIYPPLEVAIASTGVVISLVKSSLNQREEEWVSVLAAGRVMERKANLYPNAIPLGGGNVWQNYATLGRGMVEDALRDIRRSVPPKTKQTYPSD